MQSEDLKRVIWWSYMVTLACAGMLWMAWDGVHALGALFGGFWSTLNIWSIQRLLEEIFHARRIWVISLLAQIKLVILYGLGALILLTAPLSIGAVIAGFHIPFVLIVVEAIRGGYRESQTVDVL
ncbi:MAG: ATP synthase subunit I [Candidatus Hinthialibacter sp.]